MRQKAIAREKDPKKQQIAREQARRIAKINNIRAKYLHVNKNMFLNFFYHNVIDNLNNQFDR